MTRTQRMTDGHQGDLVVFVIGMTINKPWRVKDWFPVFVAMPPMLIELEANRRAHQSDPDQWWGFVGSRGLMGSRGPTFVQYWRSTDDLNAYAADADKHHRPAWRSFNAAARASAGAVGVFHETFAVPAGAHESIYVGTPKMGLGAAYGLVPVGQRGERAKERLSGRNVAGAVEQPVMAQADSPR